MHGVNLSRRQIIPSKGLPFSTKPALREKRATVYRDYFMENARVRFLFKSCVVSENERVSAANE